MKKSLGVGLVFGLLLCMLGSCVAVREFKYWRVDPPRQPESPPPYVTIAVRRPGFYTPLPVLWEFRLTKAYRLDLGVNTRDVTYDRLDSIGYRLWVRPGQVLAAGTLPVVNGPNNRRTDAPGGFKRLEFAPDLHGTKCVTPARIRLPNLKQDLTGSFRLYLTDAAHRPQVVRLDSVPVSYYEARFGSLF